MVFFLAVVSAELAVEIPAGISIPISLSFVAADSTGAIIAAFLLRRYFNGTPKLNSLKNLVYFFFVAACIAPFISAFPGAFVTMIEEGGISYALAFRSWFLGDAFTHFLITPVLLLRLTQEIRWQIDGHLLDGFLLATGLACVTYYVFVGEFDNSLPAGIMVLLPMPFLIWTAVRFGLRGTFTASLFISIVAISMASQVHGPLVVESTANSVFHIQIFLLVAFFPVLMLAILIEELGNTKPIRHCKKVNVYPGQFLTRPFNYVDCYALTAPFWLPTKPHWLLEICQKKRLLVNIFGTAPGGHTPVNSRQDYARQYMMLSVQDI